LPAPSLHNWLLCVVPVAILASLTILIGFFPEVFFYFAERSAEQLIDPTDYIKTVLRKST